MIWRARRAHRAEADDLAHQEHTWHTGETFNVRFVPVKNTLQEYKCANGCQVGPAGGGRRKHVQRVVAIAGELTS
jgi:hypothetical protein